MGEGVLCGISPAPVVMARRQQKCDVNGIQAGGDNSANSAPIEALFIIAHVQVLHNKCDLCI